MTKFLCDKSQGLFNSMAFGCCLLLTLGSCQKDLIPDTPAPEEDEFRNIIDVSKGKPGTFGATEFVYFSFEKNELIELTDKESRNSDQWDIAFQFFNGRTNGGASGTGKGGVFNTHETDFSKVTYYNDNPNAYETDRWLLGLVMNRMPPTEMADPYNRHLLSWCWFDVDKGMPPPIFTTNEVFIIRTATGKHVKCQLYNFYNDRGQYGHISIRYKYLEEKGKYKQEELPDNEGWVDELYPDQDEVPAKPVPYELGAKRENEIRVDNVKPGNLKSMLPNDKIKTMKILTVTSGIVNQADIDFVKNQLALEELDLANATIELKSGQRFLLGTKNLKKVTMPKNLKEIGISWMGYCDNLETVIVPGNSLETVSGAFALCHKLKTVKFPDSVRELNGTFALCNSLKEFTFPANVRQISGGVLEYCRNLEKVTIPSAARVIAPNAFKGNTSLKEIKMLGNLPPILVVIKNKDDFSYPFKEMTQEFVVKVPKGSKDAYEKAWSVKKWQKKGNIDWKMKIEEY